MKSNLSNTQRKRNSPKRVWLWEEDNNYQYLWKQIAKDKWYVKFWKDKHQKQWTRNILEADDGINAPVVYPGNRFFEKSEEDVFVLVL